MGWGFYMIHGCLQVFASELSVEARATALSLHAFFFFMGQTIGPIAYGFGIQHAGKVPTLLTAAAVMIALGFVCARLLRQTRPADAAATLAGRRHAIDRQWRPRVRMTHICCVRPGARGSGRLPCMARGLLHFCHFKVMIVDAQVTHPAKSNFAAGNTGYANEPPLQRFLTGCYEEFKSDDSGAVADYIPELKRANPAHFGVALVTIDGHVYEVGDSAVPFTIQSVSKAFVFALALDMVGEERVAAAIGVEPSGEAFNSIRLTNDNRPFNPMVNAGAIACSGLIHQVDGAAAFERIREKLSQFAGRELDVDDAVHASETLTGNRNRAIAWLLRNYLVLQDDVDAVLDTYFRQCAILVTARDLAVMAATLANRGVNPVTGVQVVSPNIVARTLSVMTSSGMYDYAGEWIYRVGIPAKSGVGGGIVAALPSQIGLGTFSPCLDSHGNSVRGLKVCEALSSRFDLHMLNRSADVRTCVIADYDIFGISSRRSRQPHEQQILDERHSDIRVIELVGALNFATIDYVTRRLAGEPPNAPLLILDFRRVPDLTAAGAQLLGENLTMLGNAGVTAILTGVEATSPVWTAVRARTAEPQQAAALRAAR